MNAGLLAIAAILAAYPPLPVLSPTALTGDAGDGRAYLRWNLQLEDQRVAGWRVLQLKPAKAVITAAALREPAYVARNLKNGTAYTFAVVGVLKNGTTTPESNTVIVTPHATGEAKIAVADKLRLSFGEFRDIAPRRPALKIVFPDGQELTYSNCRPMDWKTRDGEHLLYPQPFGNNVDIGQFQINGLPRIIPPEGLKDEPLPGGVYKDVQYGFPHPHITDPLTVPYDRTPGDTGMRWQAPQVDGDRVTVEYWAPMTTWGYTAWTYVRVWETWWPIEVDRHGTKYHGLARQVEVEMPSALKDGYQLMLNNGLGPAGSRKGVVSYSSGFRNPAHQVVDFSGDRNQAVTFQSPKFPRAGGGYHPTQDSLQSSPLIFYDWGKGSLTVTARSLYYHCANNSASYPEQGADGVWPNLAWDLAVAGERTPVDTVEYLYTADMGLPLPQRYVNARFDAYGDVSRRMGVQSALVAPARTQDPLQRTNVIPPAETVSTFIRELKDTGVTGVGLFLNFWQAGPFIVDPLYLTDPNYDVNPFIRKLAADMHQAGLHPGFFFRPELAMTSMPSALSTKIIDGRYDWFFWVSKHPDLVKLLEARGMPLIRNNTQWVRRNRDGSWPQRTQYQWVVMSMAGGWWDQVIWPSLWMSAKLGFEWMEMDGTFGGMQGVDYAPMLDGKAKGAVAFQPYWWRMFRSMHQIDLRAQGECTLGWRGGDVSTIGPADEYFIWLFNQSSIDSRTYGNGPLTTARNAHQLYQLYNITRHTIEQVRKPAPGSPQAGADAVRRFAAKFYAKHGPPDWIEFRDLTAGETRVLDVRAGSSPVAGSGARVTGPVRESVTPWSWSDVVWHYNDGSSAVYPAFEKVDWSRE